VCVEKCVNFRLEEKRERQTQFATTSYSNTCWLFWRSDGETLFDRPAIFIEIPHSHFFNLDGGIFYWRFV